MHWFCIYAINIFFTFTVASRFIEENHMACYNLIDAQTLMVNSDIECGKNCLRYPPNQCRAFYTRQKNKERCSTEANKPNFECHLCSTVNLVRDEHARSFIREGKYIGCYRDDIHSLTLEKDFYEDRKGNTIQKCLEFCMKKNFDVYGVEEGYQCYCDNKLPSEEWRLNNEECDDVGCTGDEGQLCGGKHAIRIFSLKPMPPEENKECLKPLEVLYGNN